jgi:hypothetical protein
MKLLLVVGSESAGEAALAEVELDGTLLGSRGLSECNGATEWAGESSVLELGDANVGCTAGRAGAGHTSGHLDGDREIHGLSSRETTNTNTGNVLGNGG